MEDRLKIAAMVASSIFQGVPFSLDDFDRKEETENEERQLCKVIARVSIMLAEEIILEEAARPTLAEIRRDISERLSAQGHP